MGLVFCLLTISGVFSAKLWVSFVANRCFVFFGLISYNLYIWHQLIASYIYKNKLLPSTVESQRDDFGWQLVFTFTAFFISILFSSLITFYFERPLMKYGVKGLFRLVVKKFVFFMNHKSEAVIETKTD